MELNDRQSAIYEQIREFGRANVDQLMHANVLPRRSILEVLRQLEAFRLVREDGEFWRLT